MTEKQKRETMSGSNIRPEHVLWYRSFNKLFIRPIVCPIMKRIHRIHTVKFKDKLERPCLMMYNHVSDYDYIAYYDIFPYYTRYTLSDALVRTPFWRILVNILFDPILRRKGANADRVVESYRATLDEDICISMTAEGEETPNGVTSRPREKTGKVIKDLNVDLLFIRIEGCYFKKPSWAKNKSKCPTYAKAVAFYKREDLQKMTPEEINDLVYKETYVNNYNWIKKNNAICDRKDRAEYMESVLFKCPKCGSERSMKSSHDTLKCTDCGYSVDVDEHGLFVGKDVVFDNLYDWDVWQKEELKKELPEWENDRNSVIAYDDHVRVKRLVNNNEELLYDDASISMSYNEIVIKNEKSEIRIPLNDLETLSANTYVVNIGYKGEYYVIFSKDHSCMRRYRYIRKIIQGAEYF